MPRTRSVTGAKALAPRRYKLVRGAQSGLTSRSSLYNDYFLPSFFHTPLCVREAEKVPGQSNLRTTGGEGGRRVLGRLREEFVQLWPGPVTKVSGGRQQGGSESAVRGDSSSG